MTTSFNVLKEPWIPVVRLDSSRDELGILPCLEQAPALREIRDPAPIIEFGLYRLLVAFVLDALILAGRRPEVSLDLQILVEEGRFDPDMLADYVAHCGDVFDLFHPERPFLQTKLDGVGARPLATMFAAAPSGSNVSHWHHEPEDRLRLPVAEAARLLTTIAPFMMSGGRGYSPSINGSPAIYALPVGRNLFETIVLNIPCRNEDSGDGALAWRNGRAPGTDRTQATTVEALTWRPRRIQLLSDGENDSDAYVQHMRYEPGDSTRLSWTDGSIAYKYDKDKVTPVRMRENRPLWRDAGPLLLLDETEHGRDGSKVAFRRPDVVRQAFEITEAAGGPVVIQVYGMRTDMKTKVFEWAKAVWAVPPKLGRSTRLGSLVQRELDRAGEAAYQLRSCIKALYPREGAGNKAALRTLADRCERTYWQRLEPRFHPLMSTFAALDPEAPDDPDLIAATAKDWRDAIRDLATEQFELAAEDMDADSDALKRQVKARARLSYRLKEVLA